MPHHRPCRTAFSELKPKSLPSYQMRRTPKWSGLFGVEADDADAERKGMGGDDALEWVAVTGYKAISAASSWGRWP